MANYSSVYVVEGGGGVILNFDLICRIKTYESEKCFYVTGILNETFATV